MAKKESEEYVLCDLDTAVPEWVLEHPETLALFELLGIDHHCGGISLRYACQRRGLSPERVLEQLRTHIDD